MGFRRVAAVSLCGLRWSPDTNMALCVNLFVRPAVHPAPQEAESVLAARASQYETIQTNRMRR